MLNLSYCVLTETGTHGLTMQTEIIRA